MEEKEILYRFFYTEEGLCLIISRIEEVENLQDIGSKFIIINQDTYNNLLDGRIYKLKAEFMDGNPRLADITAFNGEDQVCGLAKSYSTSVLYEDKDKKIEDLEARILKLEELLMNK